MKLIGTLVVIVAAAALVAAPAPAMSHPRLIGTVGPGFTISLKQNGRLVKKLKPGTYTLVVSDQASIHNFQIQGPGLNRAITSVSFVGKRTVTLRLGKGTYRYYCVPHQSTMHGSFLVG
jgi:hypothetical protein